MTDIVDPASLRPGDVVNVVDRKTITVHKMTGDVVSLADGRGLRFLGPNYWTRTWHLVSRAEPERGSVWESPYGAEFYYEPDNRWPGKSWMSAENGLRHRGWPLADMTFVRSAAEG